MTSRDQLYNWLPQRAKNEITTYIGERAIREAIASGKVTRVEAYHRLANSRIPVGTRPLQDRFASVGIQRPAVQVETQEVGPSAASAPEGNVLSRARELGFSGSRPCTRLGSIITR